MHNIQYIYGACASRGNGNINWRDELVSKQRWDLRPQFYTNGTSSGTGP